MKALENAPPPFMGSEEINQTDKDLKEKTDKLLNFVQVPVEPSPSPNDKKNELWDRLLKICEEVGRDDYANELKNMCVTFEDVTAAEQVYPIIQQKILTMGQPLLTMLVWKNIAKHLLAVLERDFKTWEAQTWSECIEHAISIQIDSGCTKSQATASDSKITNARLLLYQEKYLKQKEEIEYVSYLADIAKDLYHLILEASKQHSEVMKSLSVQNSI